jgi:T-complex protein 1 subunit delta
MTLDENERSIHDALCVMRALYQKRFLVPGGGAPEAEAAYQLGKVRVARPTPSLMCFLCLCACMPWADMIPQAALEAPGCFPLCFRAFAEAMEVGDVAVRH